MNVLFMSLGVFYNLNDSSVHLDILKRFAETHNVWLVCKNEQKPTEFTEELGIHVLRVHTGVLKNVGLIRKGINTIRVEPQFKGAIKKYLKNIKFDLVLYTTPPITFASAVRYIKKKDGAITYLMLKDIFPQNAVDLGMMTKSGVKGLVYKYFREKEKKLYKISDKIGCMSQANVDYILIHNPEVGKEKVEICPNSMRLMNNSVDAETRKNIREKYEIPQDKKVFIYGGNFGKPQGIPFFIECLKKTKNVEEAFFLIVGSGSEYGKFESYVELEKPINVKLMKKLPKDDFDTMIGACDVGLIFLDHRFTIPNFPSRLLAYMQAGLPVLACTDSNTDIWKVIADGDFGWWCESNDAKGFCDQVKIILKEDLHNKGKNAFNYMKSNYSVNNAYQLIMKSLGNK